MIQRLLAFFRTDSSRFTLFYDHENDFMRIASGQAFAALIISPLFIYIMYRSGPPEVYLYAGILFSIVHPIVILLCYLIKSIRSWLNYAFVVEFFILTFLTYQDLRDSGFEMQHFIFFFLFYLISSITIQQLYPAILYQLSILLGLLADHSILESSEIPPFMAVGFFLIVGLTSGTVVYLRRQLLGSIGSYIAYLRKIMNNPGSGYLLIKVGKMELVDWNDEVLRVFKSDRKTISNAFFSVFSSKELNVINTLKQGNSFKKQISFSRFNTINYIEIKITPIQIKSDYFLLATIGNITDEVLKREELQLNEKRYRNLYFRNKAGVFTLNNQTQIVEGNDTFFRMFENSIQKGDRLFDVEHYSDWNMIMDSLRSSKKAQSYQTQYSLRSGTQKTFVFSWYIDEQTGYIEGSVIDLTSIEKATQALKESEEKYRLIYEESNDAIMLLDGDRIVDANKRAEQLFGLRNQDLIAKNLFDLSFDSGVQLEKRFLNEKSRLSSSRRIRFPWLFEGADGVIESEVSLIEVMIGNKLFYQCVIHDITEQNKLAKEQLRAELAEETNIKLAAEIQERINAETRLQEQFLRTRAIFESSSNTLLLTVKMNGSISFFNSHCQNYFNSTFGAKIEKNHDIFEYLAPFISASRSRMLKHVLNKVKRGASHQSEVRLTHNEKEFWLELFVNPIFDTEGEVTEISMVAHNINEKKKSSIAVEESLKEKEILLKEIHHRVKNNLQVISSILNLQSSFVTDENTLGILEESRNRIRSMAIIHENLYRTEDFSSIKFDDYLKNLTANLISSYSVNRKIHLETNLSEVDLILDQAIPCGLLTNELITNSLKYAWDTENEGTITIDLYQEGKEVVLKIGDNGVGLPAEFRKMQSDTLGLQLVTTLAEQLDAVLEVDISNGTLYKIKFDNIKSTSNLLH